ncbi:helix-turn-helix domain-containing protein [Amycolatopsis sp. FBCC-B4732]|uniref:helix-turn-helix domain-containing protein n=1 Tax=Amycolatopsis sp. FBCC-B4732 TaxID=3079339 RepID=UPI00248AF5EA|nr:helix-turn-helix domain-containing protein [Amycolatopsis sp. FBCC-B4732]
MYEEAPPPALLTGVARCVWRSVSAGPKRIVPDGCLDLVVGDGSVFVAGPDTTAWSSVTHPGAELHGVRFVPGRAGAVLGVAADELRDSRVPLGDLWGREGELLAERLLAGEVTPAAVVASRLAEAPPADPAVAELVARLEAGVARVADAVARPSTGTARDTRLTRPGAAMGLPSTRAAQEAWMARTGDAVALPDTRAAQEARMTRAGDPIALPTNRSAQADDPAALPATRAAQEARMARTGNPTALPATRSAQAGDPAALPTTRAAQAGNPAALPATHAAQAVAPPTLPTTPAPRGASVEDSAEPATVGERRLRRRFVQAVGYGPATYLRVARLQRAIALAPHVPNLAALAVAAGYSDQAHLSRDCRALTGLTPRAYLHCGHHGA